jgi:hypothetical protein
MGSAGPGWIELVDFGFGPHIVEKLHYDITVRLEGIQNEYSERHERLFNYFSRLTASDNSPE